MIYIKFTFFCHIFFIFSLLLFFDVFFFSFLFSLHRPELDYIWSTIISDAILPNTVVPFVLRKREDMLAERTKATITMETFINFWYARTFAMIYIKIYSASVIKVLCMEAKFHTSIWKFNIGGQSIWIWEWYWLDMLSYFTLSYLNLSWHDFIQNYNEIYNITL